MPKLPEGTISLLFTDVEGSTAVLQELRGRYPEVLLEHDALLRGAFAAHGGRVVDVQGDAFFVCFRRARDAVAAAVDGQRALSASDALRVRMGIHTGEPEMRNGRYFGIDVHRGARIAAAAHGGQVLLSDATHKLVAHDLPDGVGLRDLGERRLKGLERAERVHQLLIEGLPQEFPPLRTVDAEGKRQRRARRRRLLASALAGAIAAAVAVPVFVYGRGGGGPGLERLRGNAVGVLDAASGRIVGAAALEVPPGPAAAAEDAAWVIDPDEGTASRVDPRSGTVTQTVKVGRDTSAVAVGGGAAWVAGRFDGAVSRIDLATNQVVQTIRVGNAPAGLAYAPGTLWAVSGSTALLTRIDTRTGRVVGSIPLPAPGKGVAVGDGSVWVTHGARGTVSRIDARTNRVLATVNVGNGAGAVAAGQGAVWVANELDGTVSRLDPRTAAVRATIPVGRGPTGIATTTGTVWVSNEVAGTVSTIDVDRGAVGRTIRLGGSPQGVAYLDGALVVPVRPLLGHRGGTLRLHFGGFALGERGALDPARSYDTIAWSVVSLVGDGLVAYKRVGGPDGAAVVPDLALSLPTPTDRGTTYTFQLRRDVRYSDGRPVRPSDVRASLERMFRVRSPRTDLYAGILGGAGCLKQPRRCNLSRGIVADDGSWTVTFRLTGPDPEFLDKLALPFAIVLPAGTGDRLDARYPGPATGPYLVADFRPGKRIVLVRNPRFRTWSTAAKPDGRPDRIVIEIVPTTAASGRRELAEVEKGRLDIAAPSLMIDMLPQLRVRYPSRLHEPTSTATSFLALNTHLPPFDNRDARRAVAYALDRSLFAGRPTCQALPPGIPGYEPYCPYTLHPETSTWSAPDLAKARALVRRSGTHGAHVTAVTTTGPFEPAGKTVAATLRRLGYRVSLRVLPAASYWRSIGGRQAAGSVQAALILWSGDYLTPAGALTALFHCGQPFAVYACAPALDRALDRATAQQASGEPAADTLWRNVDRLIVDDALTVPIVNPSLPVFVSARLGNLQSHLLYGPLYAQAWVR